MHIQTDNPRQIRAHAAATQMLLRMSGESEAAGEIQRALARWLDRRTTAEDVAGQISQGREILTGLYGEGSGGDSIYSIVFSLCDFRGRKPDRTHPGFKSDSRFVTTTELFRTPELFCIAPQIIREHFPHGAAIYCVGCSEGKECHSIAIALEASLGAGVRGRFPIHGIDRDTTVLTQARSGLIVLEETDILNALQAGISPELLRASLLECEGATIPHPFEPSLRGEVAANLTATELEKKSFLCGDGCRAFSDDTSQEAQLFTEFLARPAGKLQPVTFEVADARAFATHRLREGPPCVLFVRNVLYHLCSTEGSAAVVEQDVHVAKNAGLLLPNVPIGTLVVLGETDIEQQDIFPVLAANGCVQVTADSPFMYIKKR